MIWTTISSRSDCEQVELPGGYSNIWKIKTPSGDSCWLIGPYKNLTPLARDLRTNEALWPLLAEMRVRLGLRATDIAPVGLKRQQKKGEPVPGKSANTNFEELRRQHLTPPVKEEFSPNRQADREENARTYWQARTPEAHHIVEYNNLERLNLSTRNGLKELDHARLPCVLLAAEFHQLYFSAIFRRTHRWSAPELRGNITQVYESTYLQDSLLQPLLELSRIIFTEAQI